jgi:hypothetical protein
MIEGVLAMRGALQRTEKCKAVFSHEDRVEGLATVAGKMEPEAFKAVCGFQIIPPLKRAIGHPGIFCETVTWQWEELGDGDRHEFKENRCRIPDVPIVDSPHRKSQGLLKENMPPWAQAPPYDAFWGLGTRP